MKKSMLVAIGFVLCNLTQIASAQYSLLHEFVQGASDGGLPVTGLTFGGSALYGTTVRSPNDGPGTIFKIKTDGSGYDIVHEFPIGDAEGSGPEGNLTLVGSTLYGTTASGGANGHGTVFKINTDGTGFTSLHEFSGGGTDGNRPFGSLALMGSTLYGVTQNGGDSDRGTIYRINTDGTGFALLHEFAVGTGDGNTPQSGIVAVGSTLFGTTLLGGHFDGGVIFKIDTNGSGFGLVHEFAGGAHDGKRPEGGLTILGSTIFGTTNDGGGSDNGVVFSVATDGTGLTLLHTFDGGGTGDSPRAGVILDGSILYGLVGGGPAGLGSVFQIGINGTGYTFLHNFGSSNVDGRSPVEVTLVNSVLYGTTTSGGAGDYGTVFALTIPEPSSLVLALVALGIGIPYAARRHRKRCCRGE